MNIDEFKENPQKYILQFPYLRNLLINQLVSIKQINKFGNIEFVNGKIISVDDNLVTIKLLDKKIITLFAKGYIRLARKWVLLN